MRESWVSFFWSGSFPEMKGMVAWQKYLKEQNSEFNVKLWVDDRLFEAFKEKFSSALNKINEIVITIDDQSIVITNFYASALQKARDAGFKKCSDAFLLLQKYKMYAHASDFARLLILHEVAGFYCDFDIEPNFNHKKILFPKSMNELIEISRQLKLNLHQMDVFFRRDAQVVLSFYSDPMFRSDPIIPILRIYETEMIFEKVESDIKTQLKIMEAAKKLFEKDSKEKNSERYVQFKQLILKIKNAFSTKTPLKFDIHAADPYRISKGIDNSAGFIYCHGFLGHTRQPSADALTYFTDLLTNHFLNSMQDCFPALYSWKNPQIVKIIKKWEDAHKIAKSLADEIKCKCADEKSADISNALQIFSQGDDDALNKIAEITIANEDVILKKILAKQNLLTGENKIDVFKLKDDGQQQEVVRVSSSLFLKVNVSLRISHAPGTEPTKTLPH